MRCQCGRSGGVTFCKRLSQLVRRLPASALSLHLCDNGKKTESAGSQAADSPPHCWLEAGGAAGRHGGFGANVKLSQEQRVVVVVGGGWKTTR